MPKGQPPFQHLRLIQRYRGPAKLRRGGRKQNQQTLVNRKNYKSHATNLQRETNLLSNTWKKRRGQQEDENIFSGVPILLQIDPSLELDNLRKKFDFEIISEQEDGYVIVASKDLDLSKLQSMIKSFSTYAHGSATIASIHSIVDDPNQSERLQRILSERLYAIWSSLQDTQNYTCDVGIGGVGIYEIPDVPKRGKRDDDATWANKEAKWSRQRDETYQAWDSIKIKRETEITDFVNTYKGRIITMVDDERTNAVLLPDSFTVRLELIGRGLRDLILNYPYIFEAIEPEDMEPPQSIAGQQVEMKADVTILPPTDTAPAVCVIDSGIQEEHMLLAPAIDRYNSHCFLPKMSQVGDHVKPDGHGTRVAGAVLYGESIPATGEHTSVCWIQNARVLDDNCMMPKELFPPAVICAAVKYFNEGPKQTRLFNHSINVSTPCRTQHMSAWAAGIDALSEQRDVLIIQSAGNLLGTNPAPFCGVQEHLIAGGKYPHYLIEDSCRVANPAQSLQVLTVGSVAYGAFNQGGWSSFALGAGYPSAFSRTGFGIWGVIKPEVVEYGGDFLRTKNTPPDISTPDHAQQCYPELVRSTMYPPGPAVDRDNVGTSFSAPKVTNIAALLEESLPDDNCLLYRALIIQSARWPQWAWDTSSKNQLDILRQIGYGIPNSDRATTNTDYRTTLVVNKDPNKDPDAADQDLRVKAGEAHIYQVPIPEAMRRPGDEFDVLIEVTLSYAAQPRRTRRNLRHYLSTWVDWKSSKLEESLDSFRIRVLKEEEEGPSNGSPIPWMLHTNPNWGKIHGAKRNAGTVQKDWAVVKSNALPESFCIAVIGHKGWSKDPDSSAKYALTVSFEMLGQEIEIYEKIRLSVEELSVNIEVENEIEEDI